MTKQEGFSKHTPGPIYFQTAKAKYKKTKKGDVWLSAPEGNQKDGTGDDMYLREDHVRYNMVSSL